MNKKEKKIYIIVLVVLASLVVGYFYLGEKPETEEAGLGAATLRVNIPCQTGASTTTMETLGIGTATSTVTCNLGQEVPDTATIQVIVNASSTLLTMRLHIEESQDNIDWFPQSLLQHSSTTAPFLVTLQNSFEIPFASTTIGQVAEGVSDASQGLDGSNNRNHYMFNIPVRLQYVRVHATSVATSSDGVEAGVGIGLVWMGITTKSGI